jgi:alginate O-acetyltransferase complex protein AlgI
VLFNSLEFLLLFLPAVYGLYLIAQRLVPGARTGLLVAASLFFYAWWDVRFLPVLLVSIALNFCFGRFILARPARARWLLRGAVGANLLALGFFKYADFFTENLEALFGVSLGAPGIALPIGISFFTFTQIAYLVDASRGHSAEYRPLNYALFVTFFPHLVAGPILHHREMMPQFAEPERRADGRNLALGLSLFSVGLFKKVCIGDVVGEYAQPVFAVFDAGAATTMGEAWIGALAYTFQIYFDFSGYSDMAVGLALLFGIDFPVNFFSPYQATSIVEFWRRWHMTLSRFLRDYLYIPLGGSRRGRARRYVNLALTMLLGGLWHGASWNFVIWGGLHGVYLGVNHACAGQLARVIGHRLAAIAGWALTFLAVTAAWVFFRAATLGGAATMLGVMLGVSTVPTPRTVIDEPAGVVLLLAALLVVCVGLPNLYQVLREYRAGLVPDGFRLDTWPVLRWRPTLTTGVLCGSLFLGALYFVLYSPVDSPFLYFQF